MAKVTQNEIARRVQVSQSAVSAVLNDNATIRVNPETRRRILKLAEELNYQARKRSQGVRKSDTGIIGIIDFSGISQIGTEKLSELVDCIQEVGFRPLVSSMFWFSDTGASVCQAMLDAGVAGVILQGLSDNVDEGSIRRLQKSVPVVAIEGKRLDGLPRVTADKADGFYQLTQHLINRGHRRLTLQTTWSSHHHDEAHSPHTLDATKGFNQAIQEAGLEDSAEIMREDNTALDGMSRYFLGRLNMERLLQRPELPDAVLCSSDGWAIGALRACRETEVNVPGDLAITGFNGEEQAEYAAVPLTTVAIPVKQMARVAFNMLLSRIGKEKAQGADVVSLPCSLVIRQSCGAPLRQNTEPPKVATA